MLMAFVQIQGDAWYARQLVQNKEASIVLHDLVFANLPRTNNPPLLNPDTALHSFIVFSVLTAFIVFPLELFIARARRFLWLFGAGYWLRMWSLVGTVLPPSDPLHCVPQNRNILESLLMMPKLLLGGAHTCTDKIFSGHSLVALLLLGFWWEEAKLRERLERPRQRSLLRLIAYLYPLIHTIFMMVTSLLGRNHYLVDIVVASIVTILLMRSYFWLLAYSLLQQYSHCQNLDPAVIEGSPSTKLQLIVLWCEGQDLQKDEEQNAMEACHLTEPENIV